MNTEFILAQYTGGDWCQDYRVGKVYPLIVSRFSGIIRLVKRVLLEVKRVDGGGKLSYQDEKTFLQNWLIVPEGKYVVKIEKLKEKQGWD